MDNIIIVEDSTINITTIELILKNSFNVFSTNGFDGLFELIDRVNPVLILMDINLGEGKLDGFSIMKEIKKHYFDKPIKMVALTGYPSYFLSDHNDDIKFDFDYYIVKPMDIDRLQETLTRVINS